MAGPRAAARVPAGPLSRVRLSLPAAADADPYYNSLLLPAFLMFAGLICFSVGLRFLMFPPPLEDDSVEALAMRRSGFFALGTIAVVMDNMVFRSVGFLTRGQAMHGGPSRPSTTPEQVPATIMP